MSLDTQRKYTGAFMIPVLLLIVYYLHSKQEKTNLEKIMLLLALGGFLINALHTYHWNDDLIHNPAM